MNIIDLVRWVHVLSGAAWLGEVVTINFVLIPVLKSLTPARRVEFIRNVFPRTFWLASILAATALASGLTMSYLMKGWKDLSVFFTTRWGLEILVGGLLGLVLAVFHFAVEGRLEPRISALGTHLTSRRSVGS